MQTGCLTVKCKESKSLVVVGSPSVSAIRGSIKLVPRSPVCECIIIHCVSVCVVLWVTSSPLVARLPVAPGQTEIIAAAALVAQLPATQTLHLAVRALLQQPFLEKQKLCFVCPGREEVDCFHLVVWYPKKPSSTWCLIIVMTGAGPPRTFWLYPRLHDWIKHNSDSDTIAYSHIWFDILLLFQPCDVLSSLAWKDLPASYFFKASFG